MRNCDGEPFFKLLRLDACDRRVEFHETAKVLGVEDRPNQSAIGHVSTRKFGVLKQTS